LTLEASEFPASSPIQVMIMSALLFEFCEMIDIEASSLGSKTTANVIQRASFQPSIY